jgi:hypothetical protein
MQEPQLKINPLANYFRQPKIYIKLPSQGRFYPEGSLDISQTGEYAVYAMTAKDEIMLKTPDALMNGQATVEVIKSCVPAIIDPWKMPSIDMDAVLVAIRVATYGENMDVTAKCPACDNENDYEMNLVSYLDRLNEFRYIDQIDIPPLTIHLRPYNYREVTKTAIKALEQERIFNIINDEEMGDEEKLEKFGNSFVKLTALTIDLIVDCISSIDSPEGTVDDHSMIKEFIENAPKEIFQKISDTVTEMKNKLEMKAQEVNCSSCQHQYSIAISMDQANFFAVRS